MLKQMCHLIFISLFSTLLVACGGGGGGGGTPADTSPPTDNTNTDWDQNKHVTMN
ncbi:hypothetical protein MNBD_GAMMA25-991 [hydrothermal vent metagenome]|uniref:Uncharacterized protein n=1 Tax=hydrothermal vent metagenome TaxID=652676 RepID=A0A3B1BNG5_9ZZZZ